MITKHSKKDNSQFSGSSTNKSFYIGKRKVPQILSMAANRVEEWSVHSWKWLARLRTAILERVANGKRLSTRTMRKEQREAISKLLTVMLSYLDLKTMQVGVYNPETGVFAHLSLAYLAHKAGLSYSQAQSAMAWLYDSRYVAGMRQASFDETTGEYTHKPSARRISNNLLTDLGITDLAFNRARTKSKKSAVKQVVGRVVTKAADTVKNAVSSIFKKTLSVASKNIGMPLDEYAEKCAKLMSMMPGKTLSEIQEMLPRPAS